MPLLHTSTHTQTQQYKEKESESDPSLVGASPWEWVISWCLDYDVGLDWLLSVGEYQNVNWIKPDRNRQYHMTESQNWRGNKNYLRDIIITNYDKPELEIKEPVVKIALKIEIAKYWFLLNHEYDLQWFRLALFPVRGFVSI